MTDSLVPSENIRLRDVEHACYSAPHQLVHQRVEVRLTATIVELFLSTPDV